MTETQCKCCADKPGACKTVTEPESCGNCRYWFHTETPGLDRKRGFCRAHPPRQDDEKIYNDWWCGEWKIK